MTQKQFIRASLTVVPLGLVDGSVYTLRMSDHIERMLSNPSDGTSPIGTYPRCDPLGVRTPGDASPPSCPSLLECDPGPAYFWRTSRGSGGRDFVR